MWVISLFVRSWRRHWKILKKLAGTESYLEHVFYWFKLWLRPSPTFTNGQFSQTDVSDLGLTITDPSPHFVKGFLSRKSNDMRRIIKIENGMERVQELKTNVKPVLMHTDVLSPSFRSPVLMRGKDYLCGKKPFPVAYLFWM